MNRGLWVLVIGLILLITACLLYLFWRPAVLPTIQSTAYVDVKEGSVQLANGEGGIALRAGDRGVSQPGKIPTLLSDVSSTPTIVPTLPSQLRIVTARIIDDASQAIQGASVGLCSSGIVIASGTSDKEGKTVLSATLNGSETLFAQHSGHFDSDPVLIQKNNAIDLILDRKMSIHGQVLDKNEQPVGEAIVSIASASAIQSVTGTPFQFSPIRPGTYRIRAQHETLLGEEKTVQAGNEVVLHMGTSASVIVSVSTVRGEAVGGAVLDLSSKPNSGFHFTTEQKTDTTGIACFSEIRRGTYSIGIQHSWYQSLQRTEVVVDSVTEEVSLVLPDKNHSISGRVFDAATEQPIANAPVVCGLDWGREDNFYSRFLKQDLLKSSFPQSATRMVYTNEEGLYRFDGLWSGLYFLFVDRVKGYISGDHSEIENIGAQRARRVMLSQEEDVGSVDFGLKRCWKIVGHAYDPNKKLLANVHVSARLRYSNPAAHRGSTGMLEKLGAESSTDESGYYEILGPVELMSDRSLASLYVSGQHERYGKADSEVFYLNPGELKENADIYFSNCAIIQGTVRNEENQPIPNAMVIVWKKTDAANQQPGRSNFWYYPMRTDDNGFYQAYITSQYGQFGECFIRAHAKGYLKSTLQEPERKITLALGAEPVVCDFVLKKGMQETLEGIVVNEEGEKLAGVVLVLYCEGSGVYLSIDQTITQTDADGRFLFDLGAWDQTWYDPLFDNSVTNAKFLFRITPEATDEYEYVEPSWESIPRYRGGEKDIRIVMIRKDKERVSFRGMVVDSGGQPVTKYDIVVIPGSAPNLFKSGSLYYRWSPVNSPDGSFFLENLPASQGLFRIAVRTKERGLATTNLLRPQPNEVMEGIVIQLGEGATLQGVVLDSATGKPVPNVDVITMLPPTPAQEQQISSRLGRAGIYLVPSDQSPLLENLSKAKTNEKGEYRLENVVVPAVRVRFRKNYYEEYFVPAMNLQGGETRDLGEVRLTLLP